jgi:hypothetical protein
MYKLIKNINGETNIVCLVEKNLYIPFDSVNVDYQVYLKWFDGYEQQFNVEEQKMEWVKTSDGNTPEPADE